MAAFETWMENDLKNPVQVKQMGGNLFSADNGGNLIGVIITNGGKAAAMSGGVTGYVIRDDGATVIISGILEENKAYITLPASCYAVVGPVSIVIKVGSTTVGACHGYVYRSSTDTFIDPGSVVPSLNELLAQIGRMETATDAAEKATTDATNAAAEARSYAKNAQDLEKAVEDAEAWAKGTRNGTAVGKSDETYQQNSKYFAELAQAAANKASDAITAAAAEAQQAGGYASAAQIAQAAAEAAVQTVLDAIVSAQGNDMLRVDENGDFFILEED